jgi:hypothetical protein
MAKAGDQLQPFTRVTSRGRFRNVLISLAVVLVASIKVYNSWILGNINIDVDVPDSPSAVLTVNSSPYRRFPVPNDPFRFIPCTSTSLPPALDDIEPETSWAKLFDPYPSHWSWGKSKANKTEGNGSDPYAGRGIFYYTNKSDSRIARLAVTKFQVSGLASTDSYSPVGKKSERTIVIEPGDPGGSGTSYAWRAAEDVTERLSQGRFDVLGWDPRGVNISLPAISCFPFDADRDRWSLLLSQAREVLPSPKAHLEFVDAFYEASFRACWERQGDLSRFVSTAFVARDLEEIRKAV